MEKYAYFFKGKKLFPLNKEKIAETLKNFEKFENLIPLEDRRKVAKRIKKALSLYEMKIPDFITKYTTNKRNPLYGIYLQKRASMIRGLNNYKKGFLTLKKINKLASQNKLDSALSLLIKFDKEFQLENLYSPKMPNPYESLFFPIPERMTLEDNLKKLAEEKIAKLEQYFPMAFVNEFRRNPVRTYKLAGPKYREILDKIMRGEL